MMSSDWACSPAVSWACAFCPGAASASAEAIKPTRSAKNCKPSADPAIPSPLRALEGCFEGRKRALGPLVDDPMAHWRGNNFAQAEPVEGAARGRRAAFSLACPVGLRTAPIPRLEGAREAAWIGEAEIVGHIGDARRAQKPELGRLVQKILAQATERGAFL